MGGLIATSGQIEFIEDLLERLGLERSDLEAEEDDWGDYEMLPAGRASELLDWLQDYVR